MSDPNYEELLATVPLDDLAAELMRRTVHGLLILANNVGASSYSWGSPYAVIGLAEKAKENALDGLHVADEEEEEGWEKE